MKQYKAWELFPEEKVYLKSDVDAAIAELKKKCDAEKSIGATFSKNGAELARWVEELRTEIESLKASHYADSVDAGMRERRLRRALYKACANWAMSKSLLSYSQAVKYESYLPTKGAKLRRRSSLWHHCYEQCEAMAEEYK